MEKILNRINGNINKEGAATIIGAISAYCAAKGYIGVEETILIGAISLVVFGSAGYQQKIKSLKDEIASMKPTDTI